MSEQAVDEFRAFARELVARRGALSQREFDRLVELSLAAAEGASPKLERELTGWVHVIEADFMRWLERPTLQ